MRLFSLWSKVWSIAGLRMRIVEGGDNFGALKGDSMRGLWIAIVCAGIMVPVGAVAQEVNPVHTMCKADLKAQRKTQKAERKAARNNAKAAQEQVRAEERQKKGGEMKAWLLR